MVIDEKDKSIAHVFEEVYSFLDKAIVPGNFQEDQSGETTFYGGNQTLELDFSKKT